MPLISFIACLIPRGTSQLMVVPNYEHPLLQLRYNTGVADRDKWVKKLPEIPAALPRTAHARELNMEAEMERLGATYGANMFRKVYPLDDLFEKAFAACQIATLPGQENAVPDMAPAPQEFIQEFCALNVPSLTAAKAKKLVEAGYMVSSMAISEARAVAAVTGMSLNLIRSTIEASKRINPVSDVPRQVPSAPSEMRPSIEAPVPV